MAETFQEEAARRVPPVLDSLVMPEKILSGQSTTITWSLTGYHAGYKSKVVLFNCALETPVYLRSGRCQFSGHPGQGQWSSGQRELRH